MPVFNKERRKERRQQRKESRKARIQNAAEIIKDSVDKGVTVAERVSSGDISLRKREDRIVRIGERALIIFSEFNESTESKKIMETLYGFVERQGVAVATGALSQLYDRIIPCTGPSANLSQLIELFEDVLADDAIQEIDLIWHGHGSCNNSECKFSMAPVELDDAKIQEGIDNGTYRINSIDRIKTGKYHVDDIANVFENLDADERLRMFYTTACYGQHLAKSLVESGFSCGAGALLVNANSAIEYPLFLKNWALSLPFGLALSNAFKQSRWRATDNFVRTVMDKKRFDEVDSTKRQFGDLSTTIRTNGDF